MPAVEFPRSVLDDRPWPKEDGPLPLPIQYEVTPVPYQPARVTPLPTIDGTPPPPPWVASETARSEGEAVRTAWVPALRGAINQPAAAMGAALLLEQPAARGGALAWLDIFPDAAAIGLLPTVLGKPSRWQLLAQVALAAVARRHPERVRAVAQAQGATAPGWVERLLDTGPVDLRDWYTVPPPPRWADPDALPVPRWGDQTPLSAPQVLSLITRLRRSRLRDPYLYLDAVRDACDPSSLDTFSAAVLSGWIDADCPKDGVWAAEQVAFFGGPKVAAALAARRGACPPAVTGALVEVDIPEVPAEERPATTPARSVAARSAPFAPRPFGVSAEERDFGFRRFNGRTLRPGAAATLRAAGWQYGPERLEHGDGTTELLVCSPQGAEVVIELSSGAFLFRRRSTGQVLGRVRLPGFPPMPWPAEVVSWLDARLTELEDALEPE